MVGVTHASAGKFCLLRTHHAIGIEHDRFLRSCRPSRRWDEHWVALQVDRRRLVRRRLPGGMAGIALRHELIGQYVGQDDGDLDDRRGSWSG